MNETDREIIRYRLARAYETLEEAAIMVQYEKWNAAVNRIYYACYYAVIALLKQENLPHGTHTGVKAQFNKHITTTSKLDADLVKFYNHIMQDRQESDYKDLHHFEPEEVNDLLVTARNFIEAVSRLIYV